MTTCHNWRCSRSTDVSCESVQAVEAIQRARGDFYCDYDYQPWRVPYRPEPPAPAWLRELVGVKVFGVVVGVVANSTHVDDVVLDHADGLAKLEWLELVGTQFTEEDIEELRRALSRCDITWRANLHDLSPKTYPQDQP